MLDALSRDQRLNLMRFVCSFAWADLEVRPEERGFVMQCIERLDLDEDERRQVLGWLERPPAPESLDPNSVPAAHRALFLNAIEQVVAADGDIAVEERENLAVLRELLQQGESA
ncbi:MAG: TerB family tellurite resistance protein [Proteobacteria bacterium]|nr:TerB family tellurite resistance protein [Pseudomonadota bacterium]